MPPTRAAPASALTCGARSACVACTKARACLSRAAATWMLVLLRLARSTSSSSTGSENDLHHSPRGWASAGAARVHLPSPSLKLCGAAGRAAGFMGGPGGAPPAVGQAGDEGRAEDFI